MEENVYAAPEVNVVDVVNGVTEGEFNLASRWARLGARLIEFVVMIPLVVMVFYTFYENQFQVGQNGTMGRFEIFGYFSVGMSVAYWGYYGLFLFINAILLVNSGQSIGKKVLGIKIVRQHTGEKVGGWRILGLRSVIPWGIEMLIQIFGLINIVFIFGKKRQCLHDKIAGTIVVKC